MPYQPNSHIEPDISKKQENSDMTPPEATEWAEELKSMWTHDDNGNLDLNFWELMEFIEHHLSLARLEGEKAGAEKEQERILQLLDMSHPEIGYQQFKLLFTPVETLEEEVK